MYCLLREGEVAQRTTVIIVQSKNLSSRLREGIIPFYSAPQPGAGQIGSSCGAAPALAAGISLRTGTEHQPWPWCPCSAVWQPLPLVPSKKLALTPSPNLQEGGCSQAPVVVSSFVPVLLYKRDMVSMGQVWTTKTVGGIEHPV